MATVSWKHKAGREEGGENYEHGDLIRSVFRKLTRLTQLQREDVYGGPVLIVGISEARDLLAGDSSGLSDPYCTLVPVGHDGKELGKAKRRTRVENQTLDPRWDEVHTFGHGEIGLEEVASIRIKVKDKDMVGYDELGEVVLPVSLTPTKGKGQSLELTDSWYPVATRKSMKKDAKGELRLLTIQHWSPPNPVPVSVSIQVTGMMNMLPLPKPPQAYMTLELLSRRGEVVGPRNKTEVSKSLEPMWNQVFDWEAASIPMASSRSIRICLWDKKSLLADTELGGITMLWSTLFGDEDAVIEGHTVSINRPFAVKSADPTKTSGHRLGKAGLSIVLTYENELLPPGWREIHNKATGNAVFTNIATGETRLDLPQPEREDDSDEREPEPEPVPEPEPEPAAELDSVPEAHEPEADEPDAGAGGAGEADTATGTVVVEGEEGAVAAADDEEEEVPHMDAAVREEMFWKQQRELAAKKKAEEDAEKTRKLAAMTEEEKEEARLEEERLKRHEARKERLLHGHLAKYGTSTAKAVRNPRKSARGRRRSGK